MLERLSIRWRLALTSAGLTLVILSAFAAVIGQVTASRVRSDFVRPNIARLVSACFAACSRSLRFLKRFRLTTSPMLALIVPFTRSGDTN